MKDEAASLETLGSLLKEKEQDVKIDKEAAGQVISQAMKLQNEAKTKYSEAARSVIEAKAEHKKVDGRKKELEGLEDIKTVLDEREAHYFRYVPSY